jgi:hypothetical protein
VPHQVHQVRGVLAVVDGERAVEPDQRRELAQQPRADGVERARPRQAAAQHPRVGSEHVRGDALDAALHLGGGPARERQQHDAARIGATDDQVGDAMRQRVGLAGPGAGDDEERRRVGERRAGELDRAPLVRIELGKTGIHRQPGANQSDTQPACAAAIRQQK